MNLKNTHDKYDRIYVFADDSWCFEDEFYAGPGNEGRDYVILNEEHPYYKIISEGKNTFSRLILNEKLLRSEKC